MLEYLVELINILNQPDYYIQLVKENSHSDNKAIEAYFKALSSGEVRDEIMDELSQLLAETQSKERKKEEQRSSKISNAGQDEFPALYALLCAMTHPNLTSLAARHLQEERNGPLRYRSPPKPAVYRMLLSIAIRLLGLTIRQFPLYTNCDCEAVSNFVDYIDSMNISINSKATNG
jgi:hypothetical protein